MKSIGAQMVALRYAKMTPEERSAAAKHAADGRWAKVRKNGPRSKARSSVQVYDCKEHGSYYEHSCYCPQCAAEAASLILKTARTLPRSAGRDDLLRAIGLLGYAIDL